MRPCNQCRAPIENAALICDDCEKRNLVVGYKYDGAPRIQTETPKHKQPREGDYSYGLLLLAFCAVVSTICALVGLLVAGRQGFYTGCFVGFCISMFLFSMMTH
ncbi:MAG: hypothetical protein AB8B55_22375 [Mariniblastus sp.]